MRASRIAKSLVGSVLLSACILGEAQKIDGGSGGGGSGSTATAVTATSGPGGGGGGGLGGAGGMPPTCTSDDPGSVAWVLHFTEEDSAPAMPVANQRITQLAVVPDGLLAVGQYTERMQVDERLFSPAANSGNGFLAWFTPDGAFATAANDDKIVVYDGDASGPPSLRGVAANDDAVAVVGAFGGTVSIGGSSLDAPAGERDAFLVRHQGTATLSADSFLGLMGDPPPKDHFDDVVFTSDDSVIVSGYTEDGLALPGGPVGPNTTFIASIGAVEWVIPFNTGYAAQDAIQLVMGQGDRLFLATSIKNGSRTLLGQPIDVLSLSGVLVAELTVGPSPTLVRSKLFQGDQAMGDQAFLRDLAIGRDGSLAVVGAFFGDLIFDFGSAQLVSAGAAGQTDGFVAVLDPSDLGATHWRAFGGAAGEETVWSAAIDVCGDVSILGTFAGEMSVPDGTIVPMGIKPVYVMKLAREGSGVLTPEWMTVFDSPLHEACAAAGTPIDRNCYRLVATETGVYAAGAFLNGVGFADGTMLEATNGEDAFLVKLSP